MMKINKIVIHIKDVIYFIFCVNTISSEYIFSLQFDINKLQHMFKYGNPIILQGSGRIKTDSINQKRIEQVLGRFEQWARNQGQADKLTYSITKQQSNRSLIAFPTAGFAFGVLASYAFVHPNSKYIGKFFTLFTTWLGYKVHQEYHQAYNHSRRFGNFWNYPSDIRKMIDNNDSRYAFRWLKPDYLSIPNPQ